METGLGCWQFGPSFGFWQNQDPLESKRTIRLAIRKGICHLDTAQGYGNGLGEQLLGSVLRNFDPSTLFIASKIMPTAADDLKPVVSRSLDRLGLPCLDLLYIHYPQGGFDLDRLLFQMEELAASGLIKAIGLSNFDIPKARILAKNHRISFFQRPVSLIWTRHLAEEQAFCRENNIKLCGYSPLGLGLLSGGYRHPASVTDARSSLYCLRPDSLPKLQDLQDAIGSIGEPRSVCYAWARAKNPDVLLIGCRNREQLEQNLESAWKLTLSDAQTALLDEKAALLEKTAPAEATNLFLHNTQMC